jgi:hypothetical protein
MPGRPERSSMDGPQAHGYDAWVAGLHQKIPYDLGPLARGDPVRITYFSSRSSIVSLLIISDSPFRFPSCGTRLEIHMYTCFLGTHSEPHLSKSTQQSLPIRLL